MSRPENSFDELAGVPVHYDRSSEAGYGTRGIPFTAHCTESFEDTLNNAFEELWEVCPLGEAAVITSAGAYVDKPGMHGKGRAFDIDGIFWANKTFITKQYPSDRPFYLAVESVLRKHFGTVLNYQYDEAHQDHFHVSTRGEPGFVADHKSRVLYLQMALTHLFDIPVSIDGIVGPETIGASRELLRRRGLDDGEVGSDDEVLRTLDRVWLTLLDEAAETGFQQADVGREKTPLELLEDVYSTITEELDGDPSRKSIESAVTTFAQHSETQAWLDQFRDTS